jgi:hypothetical protein
MCIKISFRNTERFIAFFTFNFFRVLIFTLRDENFFSLNLANGVPKNPSFHTDFKNVNSKKCTKKLLAKCFSNKKLGKPQKNRVLGLFLSALFTKVKCTI